MPSSPRYRLPSTSTLLAFESAARNSSFSQAASELGTSQSAISRHIGDLESQLGARLFERSARGVSLTEPGAFFHEIVVSGLDAIHSGVVAAANVARTNLLVIACSHETSHFLVMPRFDALRRTLGEHVRIRILTYHYDSAGNSIEADADLVFTDHAGDAGPEDRVTVFREAVTPVCSPDFAAAHAQTLSRPVAEWGGLAFLELARPGRGWASWKDWFDAAGYPDPAPRYTDFDNYVYLLRAATAGQGVALGWRHFIDYHLETGALVALADGFVEIGRPHFAVLTRHGRRKPVARKCLGFFDTIT